MQQADPKAKAAKVTTKRPRRQSVPEAAIQAEDLPEPMLTAESVVEEAEAPIPPPSPRAPFVSDEELDGDDQPRDHYDYSQKLGLTLSKSLHRKLVQLSRDEGVTLEEFVGELVTEGVVIRAWEIAERKSAMRGGNQQSSGYSNNRSGQHSGGSSHQRGGSPNPSGGSNPGNGGGQQQRKGYRGGMSQNRYQNIMDDKATFLEYVRSQERPRR